jgi:predicted nucleotidyltransferase
MATLVRTVHRHGITLPADQIADLCREFDVLELAVFGSFLRDDFGPESDIDFLAVFKNDDLGPWMGKLQRLEARLAALLGREVDVVSKRDVEASENWIRRNHILGAAQVIYGS